MKKVFIVLFAFSSCFLFSQTEKNYDLYFYFDSCKNEMNVTSKQLDDNVFIKVFTFNKKIPKEEFKYSLFIDNDGKLSKGIKGTTAINNNQITLKFISSKHKKILLNNFLQKNIIDYKSFINAEFKSCIQLLSNANKIYIIDKKEDKEMQYTAYQVSF